MQRELQVWGHLDMSYGWCNPTDSIVKSYTQAGLWAKVLHPARRIAPTCGAGGDLQLFSDLGGPDHRLQVLHLNLQGCDNLTDTSLEAVASHCPDLRSINLSMCASFR